MLFATDIGQPFEMLYWASPVYYGYGVDRFVWISGAWLRGVGTEQSEILYVTNLP